MRRHLTNAKQSRDFSNRPSRTGKKNYRVRNPLSGRRSRHQHPSFDFRFGVPSCRLVACLALPDRFSFAQIFPSKRRWHVAVHGCHRRLLSPSRNRRSPRSSSAKLRTSCISDEPERAIQRHRVFSQRAITQAFSLSASRSATTLRWHSSCRRS